MPANGGPATLVVSQDDPSEVVWFIRGARHFYFSLTEYESDIWVMDLEW